MLEVNNLTKSYGKILAVDNVSFSLDDGSITVLLGQNGAGKSTIIKSVIGLLKYSGSVNVNGLDNKTEEARRIIGYIPELPALYPNLTVSEHLEFLARAYKLKDYKEHANSLIKAFDMEENSKKFGDELSKGMQQKLNICLGLLPSPEILLLDEPMIGLDPYAIKTLKDYILRLKAEGKTFLISTHIIDSIEDLWDRALIMQNGKLKANITKTELASSGKTLEQLFFEVTDSQEEAKPTEFMSCSSDNNE